MKKFIVALLVALVAAAASVANARDDEPSRKAIDEYASNYMQTLSKQKMSLRETANQLASSIWWSEKVQLLCPSYFYVNARRARYRCESVKAFGIEHFGWAPLFEVGD